MKLTKIAVNPKCTQTALLVEVKITWLLYVCAYDIELPRVFVITKLHFKGFQGVIDTYVSMTLGNLNFVQ